MAVPIGTSIVQSPLGNLAVGSGPTTFSHQRVSLSERTATTTSASGGDVTPLMRTLRWSMVLAKLGCTMRTAALDSTKELAGKYTIAPVTAAAMVHANRSAGLRLSLKLRASTQPRNPTTAPASAAGKVFACAVWYIPRI
ncbi:MAG TPA: hypothetical protein VIV60_05635 [Polyangiaceae bacterium]